MTNNNFRSIISYNEAIPNRIARLYDEASGMIRTHSNIDNMIKKIDNTRLEIDMSYRACHGNDVYTDFKMFMKGYRQSDCFPKRLTDYMTHILRLNVLQNNLENESHNLMF